MTYHNLRLRVRDWEKMGLNVKVFVKGYWFWTWKFMTENCEIVIARGRWGSLEKCQNDRWKELGEVWNIRNERDFII